MGAAMRHRGPDDAGVEVLPLNGAVLGFSFRRLAILDLSPAGHQPMFHSQTGNCLNFNGEIYNYQEIRRDLSARGVQFRGQSDSEVLLHALTEWGPAALPRLAGMFALGFYDARQRSLLLARDPLGIKPLYFGRGAKGEFLFASEMRALAATGLIDMQVDPAAVAGYLAYGSVQGPATIVRSIREFPAGSYQWIDAAVLSETPASPTRYWTIPAPDASAAGNDVAGALRDVLTTSVREHLASDVPVGVFLSAGIDSTVIASLAARYAQSLRTFTVGFDEHPDVSEAPLAARTAQRIGARHSEIQVSSADALDACRRWLDCLDQPCVDGLNTYIISEVVRREGIIVALAGLGGDELFAGYHTFSRVPRFVRAMRWLRWIPRSERRRWAGLAALGKPTAVARKLADTLGSDGSVFEVYLQTRRVTSEQALAELGIEPHRLHLTPRLLAPETERALIRQHPDAIWSISQFESLLYMGNTQLRDSDTNAMAHSIEIRVPLLDTRVLDFAYRLPGSVRMGSPPRAKHLLRTAFAEFLPDELMDKPKSGFALPVGRWMLESLRDECEAGIAHLRGTGLLRVGGIDDIWQRFTKSGDTSRYARAFSLVVLGHYLRRLSENASGSAGVREPLQAGGS